MKKIISILLALILLLSLTACGKSVGKVGDTRIDEATYSYVLNIAKMYMGDIDYESKGFALAMYDSETSNFAYEAIKDYAHYAMEAPEDVDLWAIEVDGKTLGELVEESVFNALAELYVGALEAKKRGVKITEDDKLAMEEMDGMFLSAFGNKTAVGDAFRELGTTESAVHSLWEKICLVSVLKVGIATETGITMDEMKAYYNENYMRVKHILIKEDGKNAKTMEEAKAFAYAVMNELNSGASFEDLMEKYTDDETDGVINGGEVGYIFKYGDFNNPAFEDAAVSLSVGEYTAEPIEVKGGTYNGYHIIKKLPMSDEYFDSNYDNIKAMVQNALIEVKYDEFMERTMADIEITKN